MKGTPKIDDCHDGRADIIPTYEPRRRIIAHTEYTVRSDDDQRGDHSRVCTCMVRLLRVALERPFVPLSCSTMTLWLSVEISEEFQHTQPIKRAPSNVPPEQTTHGSGDKTSEGSPEQVDGAPFTSTTRPRSSDEDADIEHPMNGSVDTLRHDNDAMRAQIAGLSSQNNALSSQVQDMALKMSDMLARLDALTTSQGTRSLPVVLSLLSLTCMSYPTGPGSIAEDASQRSG